jgi:hypothetical protein
MSADANASLLDGKYPQRIMYRPVGREGQWPILVTGSAEAVNNLQEVFEDERLTLPCVEYFKTGGAAFHTALCYQMKKGRFPTPQHTDAIIAALGPFAHTLDLEPEVKSNNTATRIDDLNPPTQATAFLHNALITFRNYSKLQSHHRVYDLGLITQDESKFANQIDIIASDPGRKATDTVWLVRRIEHVDSGEVVETWNCLTPAFNAQSIFPRQTAPPTESTAAPGNITAGVRSRTVTPPSNVFFPPVTFDSSFAGGTRTNLTPPISGRFPRVKTGSELLIKPDISAGGYHSDEQILAGAMKPAEIIGDVLLRLSLSYSNKTIGDRLNLLYVKDKEETRNDNSYTKRVSKAWEDRFKAMKLCYSNGSRIPLEILKRQYDAYRFDRKLRSRDAYDGEYRDKGVKKGRRAPDPLAEGEDSEKPRRKKSKVEQAADETGTQDLM